MATLRELMRQMRQRTPWERAQAELAFHQEEFQRLQADNSVYDHRLPLKWLMYRMGRAVRPEGLAPGTYGGANNVDISIMGSSSSMGGIHVLDQR